MPTNNDEKCYSYDIAKAGVLRVTVESKEVFEARIRFLREYAEAHAEEYQAYLERVLK